MFRTSAFILLSAYKALLGAEQGLDSIFAAFIKIYIFITCK
jgi:hypothetical protein